MPPKKKAKQMSNKDDSPSDKKQKLRNFSKTEDVLLCKAFVNVSTNPVSGTGQKAKHFWGSIKDVFDALYISENVQETDGKVYRDQDALMNRFKRHIQKKVNVFNKYFKIVKQEGPSGTPYTEYIRLAMEKYLEEEGRPFLFEDCVPILHQMPKFDPMIEVEEIEIDDDDAEEEADESSSGNKKPAAVNKIGAPMGAGMSRPPGAKAAKRQMKEEQSVSTLESTKVEALQKLADTHEHLATALDRNNQLMESKNRQESLFRMFDMYRTMGNMAEANAVMLQIQQLNASPSVLSGVPEEVVATAVATANEEDGQGTGDMESPIEL